MNHNALYSKWQFAVGRVILGVYLAISWLNILLSNQSKLLTLNIAHLTVQTPKVSIVFVATMIIFSIFFLLGIQRRIASICLWLGYLISGQMNIIIELLLFAVAFIPTGEAMSWRNIKGNLHWKLANSIFIGMWMMIGGLYFVLGYFAWKHEPLIQHYAASYIPYFWIIVYQIGVAILSIFKVSRLYAWLSIIAVDGLIQNIVCFFNADPLILSPLIFFIFAIDPDWFINKKDKNQRIVFFDGICGICNGWVDFLLDVDNYQRLTFSPLQSNFAKETLGDRALDMDSIIYFRNGKAYSKSLAVIFILQDMGGLWAIAMMFRVIPAMVRNAIYDIVAKNRYKVFGKYDTCRIPSPEEMGRFL